MMDYFRRPALAGNTLTRTNRAIIRGNVRRADADGLSTVPYFPGATAGKTIIVSVDGGPPTTVTLSDINAAGSSLVSALMDLTAALPGAESFDSDGSISIRSKSAAWGAAIEVVGGTAATALGFDVVLETIRSTLGDFPSSPEGRVGNPFGTAFLTKGEGFSAESVNRGLARVAANTDVLHADLQREDIVIRKVDCSVLSVSELVVEPTTRVFTGLGVLSGASTKEELSKYFFLVDPVTHLPPASRVTGLRTVANGNVLGVSVSKVSAPISSIASGRVLQCPGAQFVSGGGVVPGDFVLITGATNTVPWNNNGLRWVVEEVTDDAVSVRPMSSSELSLVGTTVTEEHPILELNGSGTGFGTVGVRSGSFVSGVHVMVDPPLPEGATYDLYVAVPSSVHSRKKFESQAGAIANAYFASDHRPVPNGILSAPSATFSSSSLSLTEGYARFSGRVVRIQPRTFVGGEFDSAGPGLVDPLYGAINFIYWDENANEVRTTRNPIGVFNSDPSQAPGNAFTGTRTSQHLLYTVCKSGSVLTKYAPAPRVLEHESGSVTVGIGGQFRLLEDAITYLGTVSDANGRRSDALSQFEIVLLSDVQFVLQLPDINFSVKIRGARPGTRIVSNAGQDNLPYLSIGSDNVPVTVVFEDLEWFNETVAGTLTSTLIKAGTGSTVILSRVTSSGPAGAFIESKGLGLSVHDCSFRDLRYTFLKSSERNLRVDITNSKFRRSANMWTDPEPFPSMFYTVDGEVFACHSLVVRGCDFYNLTSEQAYDTEPVVGRFGCGLVLFDGCSFTSDDTNPISQNSCLFKHTTDAISSNSAASFIVSNCHSPAPTRVFIDSDAREGCLIENSYIEVEPYSTVPGLRAPVIRGCHIQGKGDGNGTYGTLVEVLKEFSGNKVTGWSSVGVSNSKNVLGPCSISDNDIATVYEVAIQAATYNSSPVLIERNQVSLASNNSTAIKAFDGPTLLTHGTINDNIILLDNASAVAGMVGIDLWGSPTVASNQIRFLLLNVSSQSDGHTGIKLRDGGAASCPRLIGNSIHFDMGNSVAVSIEGGANCHLLGNFIEAKQMALKFDTPTKSFNRVVEGNTIRSSDTAVEWLAASRFSSNNVHGGVTSAYQLADVVSQNYFDGSTAIGGASPCEISGNSFRDQLIVDGSVVSFLDNYCVGMSYITFVDTGLQRSCVSKNTFLGGALISSSGAALVDGNSFVGTGYSINASRADVCRNSFRSDTSGYVATIGSSTNSTLFTDNYVEYPVTFNSSAYLAIERNFFCRGITVAAVDVFNHNYFRGDASALSNTLTITGRNANGVATSPAVGNVINDVAPGSTFSNLLISGMRFICTSTTAVVFSGCHISNSFISAIKATFTYCYGASTTFAIAVAPAGLLTITESTLSSCFFSNATATTVNAQNTVLSACTSSGGLLITGPSALLTITGCVIGGALFVTGQSGRLDLDSTRVGGNLNASAHLNLKVTGCTVYGSTSLTAANLSIYSSELEGASQIALAASTLVLEGVETPGYFLISEYAASSLRNIAIRGCKCHGIAIASPVNYPNVSISNNTILVDSTDSFIISGIDVRRGTVNDDAVAGPTAGTQYGWFITGNRITVFSGYNSALVGGVTHCIHFATTAASEFFYNVTISNNLFFLFAAGPFTGIVAPTRSIGVIFVDQHHNSSLQDISIVGNKILKPADHLSFGAPAVAVDSYYFKTVTGAAVGTIMRHFISGNDMHIHGSSGWALGGSPSNFGRTGETWVSAATISFAINDEN
jgi:hypothetical protein